MRFLLLSVFSFLSSLGISQIPFLESIGTVSATTTIASHESANGFDNDGATMSGSGDIRISGTSGGYTGASGGANVFITNTTGINFQIAGISTIGCTSLTLSFGAFKSTTTSDMSDLSLTYSTDGTIYSSISIPTQTTGTGTAAWRLISVSLPAAAANQGNLRLRWTNANSTTQFRLDDIKIEGTCGPEIQLQRPIGTNVNCGFSITYPPNNVGTNTNTTVRISNLGSSSLTISSFNFTGSSEFTIVSPPAVPLSIASGSSQDIVIMFSPTVAGTQNAVLTIVSNDTDESSCAINLSGTGVIPPAEILLQQPVGTNQNCGFTSNFGAVSTTSYLATLLRISNTGTQTLNVTALTLSNNSDFSIASAPSLPFSIAGGTFQDIQINFNPTSAGVLTSTLTIQNNDSDEGTCGVNLTGRGVAPCSELFFSEYAEGSGNNKYLEIYNPSSSAINLGDYQVRIYSNGALTPSSTISLSGTLASYGKYVLENLSEMLSVTANLSSGSVNFTGDDAVELYNTALGYSTDIIGTIGEDPGTAWSSGGGYSTNDKTLIRNASVAVGVLTNPGSGFPTLTTEWQLNPIDYVANLGVHGATCANLTLISSNLTGAPYTVSCTTTDAGSIDYFFNSTFSNSNQLIVQLSDATGSFTAPVNLAVVTTSAPTGTINFVIPERMATGSGYRIRILSTLPALTSNDNGSDITITNLDGSCLGPASICARITQIQIDPENGNNGTYSNTGEFIQICNVCNTDLDLSCAVICLTDNNSGVRRGECIRIPDNTILGPGECYLIGGNGTFTSGTADWPGITLDLNWHTCGCVTDTEGIPDGYVGVLSDAGEDITLFDETGALLDGVTFSSTAGAYYSQTINIPGSASCTGVNVTIPPSSAHTNTGSTPGASSNDSGRLLDCLTDTWEFANHNASDAYQNLNPLSVFDCVLATPLSVELINFFALVEERENSISWTTASEKNNDYFILERSDDAYTFNEIAVIDGNGESSSEINYNYFDQYNTSAYYRLVQIDFNGARTFYGPIYAFRITDDLTIAPNPTSGIFSILTPKEYIDLDFKIYDLSGMTIYQGKMSSEVMSIDLGSSGKGVYYLQVGSETFKIILF